MYNKKISWNFSKFISKPSFREIENSTTDKIETPAAIRFLLKSTYFHHSPIDMVYDFEKIYKKVLCLNFVYTNIFLRNNNNDFLLRG